MGSRAREVDVLVVALGSTPGLRLADAELVGSLERASARVVLATASPPGAVRTLALTDLRWALAARRAAQGALARLQGQSRPPSLVYSTTTAALLWPLPGAIRFDAPAAANRPGRHGLWQRPLERRRLGQALLLLPWSEGGLTEACAAESGCAARALVLPAPIGPSASVEEVSPERDVAAVTYAGNPHKKGFDRVLAAWRAARRSGERLVVVGISRESLSAAGYELPDEDVEVAGLLPGDRLRALLRRARVFLCAPRREDYGLIQIEALAEGCQLVTSSAPGPYAALALARELDPRLVSEDLAAALRVALDSARADYARRAAELVEPFGREAVDRLVATELLPRLRRG